MLELKNITKSYWIGTLENQVLKGIHITFRKNEFVSILGASGSGKTTLLNIIGGLDKYDKGELLIDGISTQKYTDRDWDSYRNYRVGFIFQSYNLILHQSVLSNVEIALTLSGVSKIERKKRAIEALTKVGLKDHINKKPNQLSGGQMQRVAIARALVNNPEIILADEPTGALDSETSLQIMDLLKEISENTLVIMVTHNPDLAHTYSNRIIELKDGLVVADSHPFEGSKGKINNRKIKRTSISLRTALGLSFHNLLTKKGRTLLTAFAGSIGIIGIALILALSHGVNQYVSNKERESLSHFPITLEKNTYDFSKLWSSFDEEEVQCESSKICSKDDISKELIFSNEIIRKNDLKSFKTFIEQNHDIQNYVTEVIYEYPIDLQIYSTKHSNYVRINPNSFNILDDISNENSNISMKRESLPVFQELFDSEDILNDKYEIVSGRMPKEYNELVLIIGQDNVILDSTLYALDIKDRKELGNLLKEHKKEKTESTKYSYEDILNFSYKLVLNTDYYQYENGIYKDFSNDREYMQKIVNNGLDLKIVGILKVKDEDSTSGFVGYKKSLTEYVMNHISKTELYQKQIKNQDVNVLTGEKFDGVISTYESNCRLLGIAQLDNPSVINLYPKDFDSKEKIISLIEQYNQEQKEKGNNDKVVHYDDLIKTVISGVTSIVNIISFVLIGFVAISLIVSSIMIAIITYISVLERTKEIGILRAIGASKKDISHVFNAETMIEGFIAGVLGVVIALLVCIPINIIVANLADINKIAHLQVGNAIFLILLSVFLNFIAGSIPANMASKKDPAWALRSE